jgi:hypothetical protein
MPSEQKFRWFESSAVCEHVKPAGARAAVVGVVRVCRWSTMGHDATRVLLAPEQSVDVMAHVRSDVRGGAAQT